MIIFKMTWKSLINRKIPTILCIFSIALSIALYLGIERVRESARNSFTQTISGVDLLVGARGGELNLLLYSIFHMGRPISNVRYDTYQKIKNNPYVKWTIPLSLGDSFKGYRVIGTSNALFEHYKFQGHKKLEISKGETFSGLWDVVVGAEVARQLQLKIGQSLTLSHGVQEVALINHEDSPFVLKGIIKMSGTPLDQAVLVSLKGMEAMHIGWENGTPDGKDNNKKQLKNEDIEVKQISAFLLGAKNRLFVLRLRHMLYQFIDEPIMGIIPAVILSELWNILGNIELTLKLISLCVLFVGLLGIFINLYTSLGERKREMALLRAIGAHSLFIYSTLVIESIILVVGGSLLGLLSLNGVTYFMAPTLSKSFGLHFNFHFVNSTELIFMAVLFFGAIGMGIIPGLLAYRSNVSEGLTSNL